MTKGKYKQINIKKRLINNQKGLCNLCNKKLILNEEIIDHILPKGMGGSKGFENMQLLCGHCNVVKTKKDMKSIWVFRKQKLLSKNSKMKIGNRKTQTRECSICQKVFISSSEQDVERQYNAHYYFKHSKE